MSLEPGTEAPDFTLKDQGGNDVTLSSFRGKQNVVLVFYPFTFTGVCQGELCSLREPAASLSRSSFRLLSHSVQIGRAARARQVQRSFDSSGSN